jgi:uncharacterized protein YprB with RNaseH-like and TPR domain
MVTLRNDDYVKRKKAKSMDDDKQLCIDLRDLLNEHHMFYTWFGKGFDSTFLNTRLVAHQEQTLRPALHLDGNWGCRGWRGIKPMSSKLKHVAVFFDLAERKPDVEPQVWIAARAGDKDAMDTAAERCEADVRLTVACIERLLEARMFKNIGMYP